MPHKLKLVKVLFILKVHLFYLKVVYRRTGFHIRPHVVKLMKVLFNLRVHLFCLKVGCRRTDFHRVHHILKLVKVLFILKVHLFHWKGVQENRLSSKTQYRKTCLQNVFIKRTLVENFSLLADHFSLLKNKMYIFGIIMFNIFTYLLNIAFIRSIKGHRLLWGQINL